jgi:hypothetical protein
VGAAADSLRPALPAEGATEPPPGVRLCAACGVDVAVMACGGDGCEGAAYCWRCFDGYHPAHDDAWAGHRAAGVWRHVWVRPEGAGVRGQGVSEWECALMQGAVPRLGPMPVKPVGTAAGAGGGGGGR